MTTDTATGKPAPLSTAISTMMAIEQELNAMFLERTDAIRELLTSLLARQHCVLIGDPGTGKSALVEELCKRVCDVQGQGLRLFSYLMTKFTQTEELFGPVSFNGMKAETYHRVIARRLPEAEVAYLDELWKSSSAVLNAILKIVNERKFVNGVDEIDVPLMSLLSASNELPEGEDLVAIRDRILLTHFVSHLSRANRELLMLRKAKLEPDPWENPKTVISRDDFLALQLYVRSLPFARAVIVAKAQIVDDLAKEGITISERRDGWCQHLMQAHALLEGRDIVTEDDLPILYDAFWMEPSQRAAVTRIINQHSNPINARASELKDEADTVYNQAVAGLEQFKNDRTKRTMLAAEAAGKLQKVLEELQQLQAQATKQSRNTKRLEQAITAAQGQHKELLTAVGFKMGL